MATIQPGSPAPDVTLTGPDGPVQFKSLVGERVLVFYFYPKDETAGCTAEACSFRDLYHDFLDAGADVIGVSRDTAEAHAKFKANHRLPFRLFTDQGGAAAQAFGVKKNLGFIAGRVTFVIDKAGMVRLRFDSQIQARKHVSEALEMVRLLARTT